LDFFKQNKIKYKQKKRRDISNELRKRQEDEEKIKIQLEIDTIAKIIESILVNLISKTSENYIHLSRIGIELNRIEPNWKEKTKIKHLKDVIEQAEEKFKIKVQKKHYYISTAKKVSTEKKTKKKEPDSFEKFLIETITEYLTNSQTKSISIIGLGNLLHKKNPDWKKKFEVKQLKAAWESLGDKLIISGEQNSIRIKLP
jgi:hypothetical protein